MLQRSLGIYLNELKNDLIKDPSTSNTNLIYDVISNYKILDPALGEGIFLELTLKRMIDFYNFFNKTQDHIKIYNPFLFALLNNIYGVEFNINALNATKKRLNSSKINSNYDIFLNLKHGNSLKWPTPFYENKKRLRNLLTLRKKMRDLILKNEYKEYEICKKDFSEVKKEIFSNSDNFHWELEFPEVFFSDNGNQGGGFDLIIGNPPYIRVHKQEKELKKFIRNRYYTPMKDFDSYIIFIELAIKLAKENSLICFITSDKFLTRLYAKKLRELMLSELTFREFYDISRCKESFQVDTYPIIFIAKKKKLNCISEFDYFLILDKLKENLTSLELNRRLHKDKIIQNDFLRNENYEIYLTPKKLRDIISDLEKKERLESIVQKNQVFCGTPRAKDYHSWKRYVIDSLKKPSGECLKYIVCRNIQPFVINWGIQINSLRTNYINPYFIFQDNCMSENRWKNFKFKPKILVRGNDTRITAALDEEGFVCNGIYGIIQEQIENEILLGILNSEILNFYFMFKNPSIKISGNFYSINSIHLKSLPIILDELKQQSELQNIVRNLIKIKKNINMNGEDSVFKEEWENFQEFYRQLNEICYDIYQIDKNKRDEIKDFLKDPYISKFHL
ncbi:MAG: hypothetical protein EAX96_10960 [Candidatus Lokiarchaeota archaeon]|nr:hypothetical protein [Candidatus Lokiarchaeota archaeon]